VDRPANGVSVLMEISFGEFDSQEGGGGEGEGVLREKREIEKERQ
jgi:hypothetical protein